MVTTAHRNAGGGNSQEGKYMTTRKAVSASQIFSSAISSHASCPSCIIAISTLIAQVAMSSASSEREQILGSLSAAVRGKQELIYNKFVLGAAKTLTQDLSDLAKGWNIPVSVFDQVPGRFKEALDEALPKVFAKLGHIDNPQVLITLAPLVAQLMANSSDMTAKKILATTIMDESRKRGLTDADAQDSIIAAVLGLTPDAITTIALRFAVSENYVVTIKQGMRQEPVSDMHAKGADKAKGVQAGGHGKSSFVPPHSTERSDGRRSTRV